MSSPAPKKGKRATSRWISIKNDLIAYAFMAPYLFLFIVFLLLPAAVGVYASFTKWGIIGEPKWVGLRNYTKLINSDLFIESLENTLYFVILAAIPLIVLGFLLALLVHQKLRGRNIARTIVFLPHVVSVAAVGIIFQWILERSSGLLNYYLGLLGVNPPINWLGEPDWAMPAIAITTIWWTVNGNMIIYLAGLQDIPRGLVRGGQDRRRRSLARDPLCHHPHADAGQRLRHPADGHRLLARIRPGLCHDTRRTARRNVHRGPIHL